MFLLLLSLAYSHLTHIIPKAYFSAELSGHNWKLVEGLQIGLDPSLGSFAQEVTEFFVESIYTPTGIRLSIVKSTDVKLGIQVVPSKDEFYRINMSPDIIEIQAGNYEQLFYAYQSLLQLLPPQIYCNKRVENPPEWTAPCTLVEDRPRFQWRGVMIDVCRHFFDVDTIKSIIDGMSHYKLNVLHFHLTEDQGWRLEMRNFPNLTLYGSKRDGSPKHHDAGHLDGIPYGPFYYSEEDIKEIIEYGRVRCVKIIPEIEMPGHALSLLAGYPQYSCTGGPFKPRCFWGVEQDIICAGNDEAIEFLERILDDVLEMFDSVFIHCGGDECPRTRWETCPKCQKRIKDEGLKNEDQLQCWFTQHFAKYLESKGRRLIGWDEILNGDLPFPESTVVMSWRGVSGGQKAAKLGHDVVMSPNTNLYLDYWQFAAPEPYEYIGGLVTAYNIYHYEPTAGLDEQYHKNILGIQGNLWSEYVWERSDCQYKLFPRILSVAETAWSDVDQRDWPRFMMFYTNHHKDALAAMGVVDAGLQYGTLGKWDAGELPESKWVSVEFPVDDCLNQKGTIEAGFVYRSGMDTKVRNVKFLFDGAVVAEDNHEGLVAEFAVKNTYTFNTDKKPSGKISIQAEMMCENNDNCAGAIYVYCVQMVNNEKDREAPLRNYDF